MQSFFFCVPEWLAAKGISQDFEMKEPKELNELLRRFYAEVRQKNGSEYSKSGLTNIRASIQRHLVSPPHNRSINIIKDRDFTSANSVIQGQIQKLRKEGKDITRHKTPIEPEDFAKIMASLDLKTPMGLQDKVFIDVMMHFARRGLEGLRELTPKSIIIKTDSSGQRYATLAFNENEKNHKGDPKDIQTMKIMSEVKGDEYCPIKSLETFLEKLNPACDALFQRPLENFDYQSKTWYYNRPVGVNTLSGKIKKLSIQAKCSKIYTNHCLRATAITTLDRAGISHTDICAVTGHRRVESLKSYTAPPTIKQRHHMSAILHNFGKPPKSPQPSTSHDSHAMTQLSASAHLPLAPVTAPVPTQPIQSVEIEDLPVIQRDAPPPEITQRHSPVCNNTAAVNISASDGGDLRSLITGNNFYGTVNFYVNN